MTITFANDWAEEIGFRLSGSVPQDAWLPAEALTAPAVLPALNMLLLPVVTNTQINITMGQSAPDGGGFEVRRSDWKFGPGNDGDLVLRSPVPNFTIPREAPIEQYYIRIYDGATPPNYSRFSSALFVSALM